MTSSQRTLLEGISGLGYANPFLPERVEWERAVLGDEFVEGEPVWSYRAEHPEPRANVWRILAKLEPVVEQLCGRLRSGVPAREQDLALYEDAALQLLYQRCYPKFYEAGFGSEQANPGRWRFYNEFLADWRRCFAIDGVSLEASGIRGTRSPGSGRFSARSRSRSGTSSAAPCRRHDCAGRCGNRSSRTICGVTGARCTRAWASSRR